MDGLVSKEGITSDLEAYQQAGLGGVQQFHVGGPMQGIIRDTTNAIGSDRWKALMRHAINECQRLGLSFGTHNCPGWSSSAYPSVEPQYSMLKLIWTEDTIPAMRKGKTRKFILPRQPEVDPRWNFYQDIVVLVMPTDSIVKLSDIEVFSPTDEIHSNRREACRIIRFGYTTNGKTNEATAPFGGVGLECDKMSKEAVNHYWNSYPQLLLNLEKSKNGTTFQRIEIDSYEAGGQSWTPLMPEEFSHRRGYDLLKWLPVMTGITVESTERSKQFFADFAKTGTELFTENYYGYMAELAHQHGLKLLYQPYGTNSSKPFNPINTEAIAKTLPNDLLCTEFWTKPNWGWPSLPRHTRTAHRLKLQDIYAEGFTCWPLAAWQEDPASQKVLADRAFSLGVNHLMLHAGAQNPWTQAVPGMTFGKWGSWWTPGQTWWKSGGAQLLFQYFSRCQALLQRGQWVDDYTCPTPSLTYSVNTNKKDALLWTHRQEANAHIYFIANSLDSAFVATINIQTTGYQPEIWLPETGELSNASSWSYENGKTQLTLPFDEHQAVFIIFKNSTTQQKSTDTAYTSYEKERLTLQGQWTLHFPEGWDAPNSIVIDSLLPWNEHEMFGIKYFSGTATYDKTFRIKRIDKKARYVLHLGTVKNLAQVSINGKPVAHLWKKPFRCDITPYIIKGENRLEIAVTNLWPNRMIGDEQWEDDMEWDEPFVYDYAPGKPVAGRFMKRVPDWLRLNQPRPSRHRKAVVSFKFFEKDSPLLPSGLLGPVFIQVTREAPLP